jgi:hypothetical protein
MRRTVKVAKKINSDKYFNTEGVVCKDVQMSFSLLERVTFCNSVIITS